MRIFCHFGKLGTIKAKIPLPAIFLLLCICYLLITHSWKIMRMIYCFLPKYENYFSIHTFKIQDCNSNRLWNDWFLDKMQKNLRGRTIHSIIHYGSNTWLKRTRNLYCATNAPNMHDLLKKLNVQLKKVTILIKR